MKRIDLIAKEILELEKQYKNASKEEKLEIEKKMISMTKGLSLEQMIEIDMYIMEHIDF